MTDRHAGYIVTLENDMREDDAQATINALRMVKGVLSVDPIVANIETHMAQSRARRELIEKFYNFVRGLDK